MPSLLLVFVATPLAPEGVTAIEKMHDLDRNIAFAEATCRALARAGAATFAPHLYYTRFLSDANKEERDLGIALGIEHMRRSDEVLFRLPPWRRALSGGMLAERDQAEQMERVITLAQTAEDFAEYIERVRGITGMRRVG